jgi:hypothetical protein
MDSLEAAEPVCFSLRPRKLAREVMLCSVGEQTAHRPGCSRPGNLRFPWHQCLLCVSRGSTAPAVDSIGKIRAIGAEGLIVEVHPAPEKAISDGAQSLDLPQFQKMMKDPEPYIQLWSLSRKREVAAAAS